MWRLLRNDRGGVAIAGAAAGMLVCLTAGVVIDGASTALYARRLQTAADLAALAAARDLPRAQAAAAATVESNLELGVEAVATTGIYRAEKALQAGERFTPAPPHMSNGVEVRVTGPPPLWFTAALLGRGPIAMTRVGRAAVSDREPLAMLTIGSRLAGLDGGIANQLLSALTGSNVGLSVMDYDALAKTDIDLLTFSDALAAAAGVEVGDYDRLLDQHMDAGRMVAVLGEVSEGSDAALDHLARAARGETLRIGEVVAFEVDAGALRDGLDAKISALDLTMATLQAAGGDRQVRLSLPARTGLASIDAWLAIGERPNQSAWLTVDDDGGIVIRTAQSRLYLHARTSESAAMLGRVAIPLLAEVAAAEARLANIVCDGDIVVEVAARPGVGRIRFAEIDVSRLDDFTSDLSVRSAAFLDATNLARVTGEADLRITSTKESRLRFTEADIADAREKTARSSGFVASPAAAMMERLNLKVETLAFGVGSAGVATSVAGVIAPLAPVLDQTIDGLLSVVGLSLGEADVSVPGVSCPSSSRTPVLVG